ncbi:hypothetical protein RchiOBHm_Chr5g0023481 [Rosa chinensis]|uniref:Uncharacterized protein n=1 Tax=Rosa chinensis TaxID=74649 RepID=A0A2P6Q840_ROSCH|nr:hypothetical protein RchiOBHm_Chr5g0023481 [Rosa chinensis]
MIRIQNGSHHKASCSVYMISFIILLLLVSSEIVSAARVQNIPISTSEIPSAEFVEITKAKSPSLPVGDRILLAVGNNPPIGVPVEPSPPDHIG